MGERITLRQIAARAGCSVATVSHALRGEKYTSTATQARIQALAREMGYVPDPVLAALGARAFRQPGRNDGVPLMLLASNRAYRPENGAAYLNELRELAPDCGYRILHENITEPTRLARSFGRWRQQGIRGIFITDHYSEIDFTQYSWSEFPVIFFGGYDDQSVFDTVRSDVSKVTDLAWRRCLEYGYRRIGAAPLQHPTLLIDDMERAGICESYVKQLPREDRIPVLTSPIGDQAAFNAWFKRHRPEVVIGFNDSVSYWLDTLGVRMPEDCGFVSLVVTRFNQARESGPLLNDLESARVALQRMDGLIRHKVSGKPTCGVRISVPPTWHEGTTLVRRHCP